MPAEPACAGCGHPMTPVPGYTRHPCCDDPKRPELFCTGCGRGPAGCPCRTPRRWRPSAAAEIATGQRLAEVLGGTVLAGPPPRARRAPKAPPGKCGGCGHAGHPKGCRARAKARSVVAETPDGGIMRMCGYRPSCPCSWRTCKCGAPVMLAAELPPASRTLPPSGEVVVVSIERDPGGETGNLAVRTLADGYLAVRTLAAGEEPGRGERRATEHTNEACPLLAKAEADPKWLSLRGAA